MFYAQITPIPSGCLIWKAHLRNKNHRNFFVGKQFEKAHRLMYRMEIGPIPKGLLVCYTCDNPPCVNPEHFFLGTDGDNIRDAIKKGRLVNPKGSLHPKSKLTEEDVIEIRENYRPVYGSLARLAKWYHVTDRCIAYAVNGGWKHI